MKLDFYKQPFTAIGIPTRIHDAKHNFVFQFEPKFINGDYRDGDLALYESVLHSLNTITRSPIEGLVLSVDEKDPVAIYKGEEHFITIRGWGNLTGIGGYNFDAEKASKIQDDFRDWLIWRLMP